jgi:hypothetical protein
MKRRPLLLSLAFLAVAAAPASLHAQKLATGTWTGTIAPPDAEAFAVTFAVSMSGDTTRITASLGTESLMFDDVKVLADRITFTFDPGDAHVSCTLMLGEAGVYKGDCLDTDGGTGVITMVPPKKE